MKKLPDINSKEFRELLIQVSSETATAKRHKHYKKTVDHARAMAVHVEGTKPVDILERNRPHEDPAIREYRLASWEPVTKSFFKRVFTVIRRALNDKLFAVQWPEVPSRLIREEETPDKYLMERFPIHGNVFSYIREIFLKRCFSDPNAVLYIEPIDYEIDQGELFSPIPKIVKSEDVLLFEDDAYYILRTGKKEVKLITADAIRVYDVTSEAVLIEEHIHNFGVTCAFRLGGIIEGGEPPFPYESFIAGVLPHWNKAVSLITEEDGGITSHLYMESYEVEQGLDADPVFPTGRADQCDVDGNPLGEGDAPPAYKITESYAMVPGTEKAGNSFTGIKVRADVLSDKNLVIPPKGYIEKNMNILEFTDKKIVQEIERGYAAINMDIINKIGSDQSGIAKTIDRSDLDAFLLLISDHIFDVVLPRISFFTVLWKYAFILTAQQIKEILPVWVKPQNFDVYTLEFLTEELKSSDNLPDSFRKKLVMEIADKRFNTDVIEKKRIQTIAQLDPFYGVSAEDLFTDYSNGIVRREDWFKHRYIESLVNEIIVEDKSFLDLNYNEKQEILDKLIASKLKIDSQIIGSPGIEGGADVERTDIEAEARANLKGSVGGTQAILEVQKSVAQGITQYDAAIALLMDIFGYDQATAKMILGDPKKITAPLPAPIPEV